MNIITLKKIPITLGLLLFSSMALVPFHKIVNAKEYLEATNFNFVQMEKQNRQGNFLASNVEALENSLWYLTKYATESGDIVDVQVFADNPQIRFQAGRVSGNSTCNRFLGSYTWENNKLTIKPEITTLMSCPEEFMAQEQRFIKAMAQVSSYKITDSQLQLLDGDEKILLSFDLKVTPALTNTLWQLVGYNNGKGGVVSLVMGTNINATFDANGGLTGFAGCNNYLAGYTLEQETLTISSVVSTRKFCAQPEGTMEQESAYLQALETVTSFSIDDNILTLRTDSGATAARFKAIEISD